MEDNYNLDEVKGFVKNYCDPEVDVDQQLKDSAWILLQELEKCINNDDSSREEDSVNENSDKQGIKNVNKGLEHKKEVLSEKELKRLQNKGQGNSSYFQFAKNQIKAIGMAGVVAMGAGVVTQTEIVKNESAIIVEHVRKEVPAIDQIINKIKSLFSTNTLQVSTTPTPTIASNAPQKPSLGSLNLKIDKSIVTEEKPVTDASIEEVVASQDKPNLLQVEQPPSGGTDIIDVQTSPIPQPIIVRPITEVNPSQN